MVRRLVEAPDLCCFLFLVVYCNYCTSLLYRRLYHSPSKRLGCDLSLFLSLQNITFTSCAAYTVYVSPVSSFSLMTLTHICTSFSYPCPHRRSLQTCFTPPVVLVWRHFSHLCIHHVNSSWLDPHIYMNDITRSLSLYTVGYT